MHFFKKLIIFTSLNWVIFTSYADMNSPVIAQCPVVTFDNIIHAKTDNITNNFTILSNEASIKKNEIAQFTGDVSLTHQDKAILAEQLTINRHSSTILAEGNIHFQNKNIDIFASSLILNEDKKTTTMIENEYQLNNSPGHGGAKEIHVDGKNKTLTLSSSSFSTCYGDNPDWQMRASEIKISADKKTLQAFNARFSLFNIPVLYLPYISLPIASERQSGFLYPKISSSNRSGLVIETPYYWSIAENMDATFTPKYMSDRGTQLINEFRYLTGLQSGQIDLEYLYKDKKHTDDEPRYLARFQHIGTFAENFRIHIDYSTISDDNYLVDIGSTQFQSNDAYIYQQGELSYFSNNWQATVKLQDFQVLGNNQTSYKTLPQIELSTQQHFENFDGIIDLYSEFSHFTHSDKTKPSAQRYHLEAGLLYPIVTPAWFLNSEFKLLQTYYKQENIALLPHLDSDVYRTIPKIRIHSGVNFDRELSLFGTHYRQTLEPQLQYLYVDDIDQSNIAFYDTTTLQDDYNGLFRERRNSGFDRISQANQLSWGVTSRFLSNKNQELFRMSLGRIIYIKQSQFNNNQNIDPEQSALAAEVSIHLSKNWQFSSDIQYNTKLNHTSKSQATLDYQFNNNQTIQLNHRYTRDVSGESLEQISLATNVNLGKNWHFVGRYTKDLQGKRSIESYAGLEYSSCCWGIRFTFHRNINSRIENINNIIQDRDTFDSSFNIQFVYNGINSKQSSNSINEMLNASMFGYKRPYFINN